MFEIANGFIETGGWGALSCLIAHIPMTGIWNTQLRRVPRRLADLVYINSIDT